MPRSIHENPEMMASLERMANQDADPIARDIAKKKLEHARQQNFEGFTVEPFYSSTPPPPPEMPDPSWDTANLGDTSPMRDLVNRVFKLSFGAHQRNRNSNE